MALNRKILQTNLQIVELEENSYHLMINAKVSGIAIKCILDTGASHSCIDKTFAIESLSDLQLSENKGVNAGIGGSDFEVFATDVENFKIGRYAPFYLQNIAVIDLSNINQAYRTLKLEPIQMILGGDFFVEHSAVIDYGLKKLSFLR